MKYIQCDRCHISARMTTNQIKTIRLAGHSSVPRDLCRDCLEVIAKVFGETFKKPKTQTWVPDAPLARTGSSTCVSCKCRKYRCECGCPDCP